MRVAAIDCGTNSIRLLIADVVDDRLEDLERTMRIVRLGEGTDRTGRLSEAALGRTFAAVSEYGELISSHQVDAVRFVATSASRDAENAAEFQAGVQDRLGVLPEVITGAEEARLSFDGATRQLRQDVPGPYLVADIGGGSTELVHGDAEPDSAASMDVGCVRLTERHFAADPPSAAQVEAAISDIDSALSVVAESVPLTAPAQLVGLAGSVTTVAALSLGLPSYDPRAIHGSRVSRDEVDRITAELLRANHERRLAYPVMHPGRADVIIGGALVLDRLMRATAADDVLVSERDILDGIAWSLC
jgi:exopolyphosphatase/guanosine-5'-triphosphate,3'-diphosphate pyrophosphatase